MFCHSIAHGSCAPRPLNASCFCTFGSPIVRRVHNDQTFVSAPRRVRDHLPAEEAEARLRQRFAIINVWRPIGTPVETSPLALCDARSIAREDLVASDLVYRDKVGETYSFQHNANHRWYYFPHVRPDEVVLLKNLRLLGHRRGPPRRSHRLRPPPHSSRCRAAA